MIKITLDEFCNHWVKSKLERSIVSRFEKNVFDFATLAGGYSKRFFTTSFLTGGFYGTGAKWQPRESKWGKKFTHPVMNDTGTLKNAIKGEAASTNRNGWRENRTKIFSKGAGYSIWTTEVSVPRKGKRGRSGRYGRYAAIHNSDPKLTGFTVNQYSSRKPVQRQFIGFSKRLDNDISKFYHILFRGFPHDTR
ncbi:MAG: hypothetical protein LBV74_13140 [Tannerella sp.]|jgi:hypothetical protein|nr:hypothetical protein [Tannerella sp.]